ncbi:MAG: AAA family ATPase [Burkholderiales bacterium]|nr:AAA family ATPase [Burkholderiales bacterium]
MELRLTDQYRSLTPFVWKDIPPFTVITGPNGTGKTQLLETFAIGSSAVRIEAGGRIQAAKNDHDARSLGIEFRGDPSQYSQSALHLLSDWTGAVIAPSCDLDQLSMLFADLKLRGDDGQGAQFEEFANAFCKQNGISLDTYFDLAEDDLPEGISAAVLACLPTFCKQNLPLMYFLYENLKRFRMHRFHETELQAEQFLGEPPWHSLNRVLEAAAIPYEVVPPTVKIYSFVRREGNYVLQLRHIHSNVVVPFERFSSGEKVIFAMSIWEHVSTERDVPGRLLILDEPDAHLHPSLTRSFLNVLQQRFIGELGIRVVMTTHSPSTVALAPSDSLFVMASPAHTPESPPVEKVLNKGDAIAMLTSGFLTVDDDMRIVLLEGRSDRKLYENIAERLSRAQKYSLPLSPTPSILFLHGAGCETTKTVVGGLRKAHYRRFHAVLDRDGRDHDSEDGFHYLLRDGMENYLYDPILLWAYLYLLGKAPSVPSVKTRPTRLAELRDEAQESLQGIVDKMWESMREKLNLAASDERTSVEFCNGKKVLYPNWFLNTDDHEYKEQCQAFFRPKPIDEDKLIGLHDTVDLIPIEFLNLLKKIKESPLQ